MFFIDLHTEKNDNILLICGATKSVFHCGRCFNMHCKQDDAGERISRNEELKLVQIMFLYGTQSILFTMLTVLCNLAFRPL